MPALTHKQIDDCVRRFPNASKDFLILNGIESGPEGQVRARPGYLAGAPGLMVAGLPRPKPQRHEPKPLGKAASDEGRGLPRAPVRPVARRPIVEFTLFRCRKLDGESKWAAVKFALDGLRYAGLIADDRECDIVLIVTQERVGHRHLEGTGVVITYPGSQRRSRPRSQTGNQAKKRA